MELYHCVVRDGLICCKIIKVKGEITSYQNIILQQKSLLRDKKITFNMLCDRKVNHYNNNKEFKKSFIVTHKNEIQ